MDQENLTSSPEQNEAFREEHQTNPTLVSEGDQEVEKKQEEDLKLSSEEDEQVVQVQQGTPKFTHGEDQLILELLLESLELTQDDQAVKEDQLPKDQQALDEKMKELTLNSQKDEMSTLFGSSNDFSNAPSVVGTDGKNRLRVTIAHIINPGEFYVTLDCKNEEYEKMNAAMDRYFAVNSLRFPDDPYSCMKLYDVCAIKDGGHWKRGKTPPEPTDVDEIVINGRNTIVLLYKVKLLDEAREVLVKGYTIRPLPFAFRYLRDRVIQCSLSGIDPAGAGSWSEESTQEFQKIAENSNKCLYILRTDHDNEFDTRKAIWPVELFVSIDESLFESDSSQMVPTPELWISVNYILRRKGFAVADDSQFTGTIDEPEEPIRNLMEVEDNVVAFYMKQQFELKPDGGVDLGKHRDFEREAQKVKWFVPKPVETNTFCGKVTFVGDNCSIYIQDFVKSTTSMLKTINAEVAEQCEGTDPPDVEWEVGDICLARYSLDNKWYRAEITKVNVHQYRQHVVKFVDYGNFEYVTSDNIRRAVGLTMRPLQANVFYFDNLAPITENWENPALEAIHTLLCGKIVRVEMRELISGFYGIVSMIFSDGTNALDMIVARGAGKYLIPPRDPDADLYIESHLPSQRFWWDQYQNKPSNKEDRERGRIYKMLNIPEGVVKFPVDISSVIDPNLLVLQVCGTDNLELMLQLESFTELQETLQKEAGDQYIASLTKFEACICKYEDIWYRAVVIEGPTVSNTVYVQYVDYGNTEERGVIETRMMKDEWFAVPTHGLPCRLFGYKYSGCLDHEEAVDVLKSILSTDETITATVKKIDKMRLHVELRLESGVLLYQDLIDNGFYVPC